MFVGWVFVLVLVSCCCCVSGDNLFVCLCACESVSSGVCQGVGHIWLCLTVYVLCMCFDFVP